MCESHSRLLIITVATSVSQQSAAADKRIIIPVIRVGVRVITQRRLGHNLGLSLLSALRVRLW